MLIICALQWQSIVTEHLFVFILISEITVLFFFFSKMYIALATYLAIYSCPIL